ncbi:SET domain-containing protein [Corallococcus exiguus]|uniref:SET domain-containing protein n=1 Tax=Corallococcus TaxID=83461 RepID=UPI000EA2096B|nr:MULTISPECIES: SET domain-containing protein-lysine N-methyltransferase [Corallococcus]NNC17937.1 SET domain-containing protein [Corallococcus exiguus]NRD55286.1 SET domain-containing protein-lysine N-methyltransferase [Corallococcus exiguus]RKH23845.1 SET domain-containing protein [Corallococcus sp. CA041A]RKI03239.1 SET domain-containing protein [Corallococcus sp. AB030]RUO90010.1 SET domain-containing protein [Corallococcus sp. AB018]
MTSPSFQPTPSIPFELRQSPIQGTGAFATRRIRKGARIIEYIGERITQAEADARYDDESMERHHTFLFNLDDDTVLDAGTLHNESRYINHSCEPNCQSLIDKGRIHIYALRAIEPGEELSYDYAYERSPEMEADAESLYVCRCGTPSCRGTILAPEKKAPARRKKAAPKSKSTSKTQVASKSKSKAAKKSKAAPPAAAKKKRGTQRAKSPGRGRRAAS